MRSSNLQELIELSQIIMSEYNKLSDKYSSFQNNNKLSCLEGCGKCCFRTDLYCSPIELLPMSLYLVNEGKALEYLDKLQEGKLEVCVFLKILDKENYKAYCGEYEHRPIICRTFGVSARLNKFKKPDYSVCKLIKENKPSEYQRLIEILDIDYDKVPFIHLSKNQFYSIDPKFLEDERPIHESLRIMLEKVMLIHSYSTVA